MHVAAKCHPNDREATAQSNSAHEEPIGAGMYESEPRSQDRCGARRRVRHWHAGSMTDGATQPGARIDASAHTLEYASGPAKPDLSPAEARAGTLLKDSYRLERRLGAGGMGEVYLAEHVAIQKKVAIKILGAEYANRPELKERFLREARAAAAIDDEHVIAIHDFGDTPDGSVFFAMEYLQGEDLAQRIERDGALPWPRAREVALQICGALAAAHARGIIHRDMKPANVFCLDRPGREVIKVLDFGIAKLVGPEQAAGQGLTRTGMLFGTPEYMSPEQAQGEAHDHRVDIYALGVILFEMLTGAPPFRADTFMALLGKHIYEAPPRPSEVAPRAEIPGAVEAVVLKALQKDPDLRFQTMTEMAAAIAAADDGVAPRVTPEQLRRRPTRGTAIDFSESAPAPSRRAAWMWIAPLTIAACVAVAVVAVLGNREAPPQAPAAVAGPTVEPAAAASSPEVPAKSRARQPAANVPPLDDLPAPPEPTPMVSLRFDTGGVAASVYDEHDAPLGSSDAANGLTLPRGEAQRRLTLRAPGYPDLEVMVLPDRDRTVDARMVSPGKPRPPGKAAPRPDPRPPKPDTVPVESKPDPPAKPPDPPPTIPTVKDSPELMKLGE